MMAKEKRRYFSLRRRDKAFAYHQNHFRSRARAEDSGYSRSSTQLPTESRVLNSRQLATTHILRGPVALRRHVSMGLLYTHIIGKDFYVVKRDALTFFTILKAFSNTLDNL